MIKVTGADGIKYIIDGERYWPEEALKEALGCKDDDIFGEIKKLKQERDELREKCDKLKARANAMYGASCGYSEYSGDKAPAFRCNVISYSLNFGPIARRLLMDEPSCILNNDSIRVELDLTPNANYKGTFDMEDLKKYIQEYGREKKLGINESVDYQNAKVARAELAHLYKTVLGKEKLDTDLSPHEVMKAILDAVKKLRDAQFASDQCLRSVYMHIYEGTGYKTSDIYAAPDKIADWIITRYDSTKNLSHMETLCEVNDCIDELCDKYNVVQPDRIKTTRERLDYIFSVLAEHREKYNSEWKMVDELKTSLDRYARLRSNICTALFLGGETSDEDILERVRKAREHHDKLCEDYIELHENLMKFRKKAIEDLKNRDFFFRPEEDEDLPEIFVNLLKRYDVYFSRYKEQFGLRREWRARYESEHERANGVQKALDREREKCQVKDISLETTKKQYEKVCNNLETAECALNGMRSKVRELQEEKTKVITAIGQDIWDDCLK